MEKDFVSNLWAEMDAEKGDLIDRAEAFSRWTVAAIMPPDGGDNVEQIHGNVPNGARLVNHLANRIVDVLFPVSRPFFTVALTPETRLSLEQELGEDEAGKMQEQIQGATARLEEVALRKLRLTEYRPVAIMAAKHLIVTGNSILRRMPTGERVLYPVNRYCLRRDLLGNEVEVVLSDKKMLSTFDDETRELIEDRKPETKPEDVVELFTYYKRDGERWSVKQEADGIHLDNDTHQNNEDYDLLVLDWSLHPGEHYARGLVEENATLFHTVDVSNEAISDLTAIIADVKFFVRPGSPLAADLAALNAAARGTYWPGNADDISVPDMKARADLSALIELVARREAELDRIFLMSNVRDAERVTAEEIRMLANELESSFGGLYSQLAQKWQQKEADYAISKIDFATEIGALGDSFEVLVTTGLESLSREGQIDNLRLAIGDLTMMEAVPEELRAAFNPLRFAKFVFTNRSVDLSAFLNTKEEMEANRQNELAQAGRLEDEAATRDVATYAGKAAADKAQT